MRVDAPHTLSVIPALAAGISPGRPLPTGTKQVTSHSQSSQPNFASGTIWTGDCLEIMRGMNSQTVDLIDLDPPFH